MFNKKSTAGFILVFAFLFLCRAVSYAQPAAVKGTTYAVISDDYCCGGSVPDTASYAAMITTDDGNSKDQPRQGSRITFYRIYCKVCCFILPAGKQALPENDRVTDPALIKKLRVALKKQLADNLKAVSGARY